MKIITTKSRIEHTVFTLYDLNKAIKEIKKKKSCVCINFYCRRGLAHKKALVVLFNMMVGQGKVPETWCHVTVSSFYKGKGDKKVLNNQRGVFVTQNVRKIFEKMIFNKIYNNIDESISDFQEWCKKEKEKTIDHLFTVRHCINHFMYMKKDISLVFLDLEKCFDRKPLIE